VPLALLGWLRAAPDAAPGVRGSGPAARAARASEWVSPAARLRGGLGALRGGAHLAWIAVHSVGIWLVASTLPDPRRDLAIGLDLGGPIRTLAAAG
jgi:hypothetical protein